jgi:hypothetical protein
MLDTVFNRVVATSLKGYSRVITDNITTNQVILWKLGQMGGIETRPGATSIVEPVIIDDNLSVQSYAAFDPLNMTLSAGITAAEQAWKQIAGVGQIAGIEKFKNSGQAAQVINLWDAIGKQLSLSMRRTVSAQLFNDGTGNGGKDLTGLLSAVQAGPPWNVYEEIDSNAIPNWRNYYDGTPNITAEDAAAVGIFRTAWTKLVNAGLGGSDRPDIMITTQKLHEFWETKVLMPIENYERVQSNEDMARAGFTNFLFKGVAVVWDRDMLPNLPSTAAGMGSVALNLDYAKFVMGEGYDFTFTDPIRPDNQDAESVQCLLYANFLLTNRRRQGRTNFQTAV